MKNKKEKTFYDGMLIGFAVTAMLYSILLGTVINILTK
jgi:hypothetical protein